MRLTVVLAAAIAVAGCGTFADPTEWMGGADVVEPTPLVDLENQIELRTLWSRDTGAGTDEKRLNLVPRVVADTVYVADAEGRVQALVAETGATRWQVELDVPVSGGPGAGEGLVLVGTSDADVIALEAGSGAERWRARVSSEVLSAPAAGGGVVVVQTIDGKVIGLETTTGKERWRYEREVPILTLRGTGSPVLSQGAVVVGTAGGKLVALRADDGSLIWEEDVAIPTGRSELERLSDIDGDPLVVGGGVFAATYQGNVAAVEQRGGRTAWRSKMSSYAGMAAYRGGLYIADDEGMVWALNIRNGDPVWSQDSLLHRRLSNVVVAGGQVIVGDFEGYLHLLNPENGTFVARTRVGSSAISTGLRAEGDVVYVQNDSGELAAIRIGG